MSLSLFPGFSEVQVHAEAFDPLEVYFCAGGKLRIQFHSFTYDDQFPKYHLLKMLSFFQCVFLTSL